MMRALLLGFMLMGVVTLSETPQPKCVPPQWVLAVMRRVQPSAPHGWYETYEETAEAIAVASNEDPLFDGEDGPMRTAALLLSIAWFESRFKPNAIDPPQKAFGLFQIEAATVPELTMNVLLVPRESARIALRLVRTSLRICGSFGWNERLGWYAAGRTGCREEGRKKSVPRMLLAERILREHPDLTEGSETIDEGNGR